jgi:hypothetical protein
LPKIVAAVVVDVVVFDTRRPTASLDGVPSVAVRPEPALDC